MNKKIEKQLNELKKVSLFEKESDYDSFTDIVEKLRDSISFDKTILKELFSCFNNVDAGEIQYELVDLCEEFPSEIYIPVLLEEAKLLKKNSKEWFEILFYAMLNTEEDHPILLDTYKKLDSKTKHDVYEIIREIAKEDDDYKQVFKKIEGL